MSVFDVVLIVLYLLISFGVGYIMGVWKEIDRHDREVEEMYKEFNERIMGMRKDIDQEGEWWKQGG